MMPDERERTERLQVVLTTEELKAVDDFRFEHRLPSRAAARAGTHAARLWSGRGRRQKNRTSHRPDQRPLPFVTPARPDSSEHSVAKPV